MNIVNGYIHPGNVLISSTRNPKISNFEKAAKINNDDDIKRDIFGFSNCLAQMMHPLEIEPELRVMNNFSSELKDFCDRINSASSCIGLMQEDWVKSIMAPNSVLRPQVQEAQLRGCKFYDKID
jgi:hypothetical protein